MSLNNEAVSLFSCLSAEACGFVLKDCALSACQTCASHDGEDFQTAGNHRRDGFSTFVHSSV